MKKIDFIDVVASVGLVIAVMYLILLGIVIVKAITFKSVCGTLPPKEFYQVNECKGIYGGLD